MKNDYVRLINPTKFIGLGELIA